MFTQAVTGVEFLGYRKFTSESACSAFIEIETHERVSIRHGREIIVLLHFLVTLFGEHLEQRQFLHSFRKVGIVGSHIDNLVAHSALTLLHYH